MQKRYRKNTTTILYKGIIVLLIALCLAALISGSVEKSRLIEFADDNQGFILSPCRKADGRPYMISIVELDPAIESSYLWLKGFLTEMHEMGYISADLDFKKLPKDYEGLYQAVLKMDLGGNIAFDPNCYLLTERNGAAIAKKLKTRAAEKQMDLVIGMGTDTGLFVKELDLGVPFLTAMSTDPVAAGIIQSKTDTGDPDTWALVEDNLVGRQLECYKRIFGFEKLGMITVKELELIAAIPDYEKKAEELDVELVKKEISERDLQDENLTVLKEKISELENSDIDAFLLAYGVLEDEKKMTPLFSGMIEKKIPLLICDGNSFVKNGGLICVSFYDYEGYGHHAAKIASSVFHGKNAGDFSCIYASSPYIAFNIDTAKKIGYQADFKFLQSCDEIYHVKEQ